MILPPAPFARPLAQLRERFPGLHKAEFSVAALDTSTPLAEVEGLAAVCPVVHLGGIEAIIHFTDRNGLWTTSGCDMGCSAEAAWEAAGVGLRVQGEDDDQPAAAIITPRFHLEPLAKLLAEDIPPTPWLLAPYVYAGSFGELVGPPGKGKTTFMAWMIMQMAMAGHRCAIIEEEGSRRGLQRLLRRALEAVGGGAIDNVHFMHAQGVNLLDKSDVRDLSQVLVGCAFVLLDSFNLVTPGLDEDKAKDMGPVIKDIKELRKQTGAAIWLNHHSGKSKWKAGEIPRLGDGRGSSALPGALDAELSMKPVENQETGFIQFGLYVTKMREGDDQVSPRLVSIARNGPAAIVEMSDLGAESMPQVDAHLTLDVLAFVSSAGVDGTSKNKIEKEVKGDTNRIRDALNALKYAGKVEEFEHGKYSRWRAK